jgi:GAF domain-containing protein
LGLLFCNGPPLQQTAAKWKEYGSSLRGQPKARSFGAGFFICVSEVTTMASSKKAKKEDKGALSRETNVMKTLWHISQSLYQYIEIDDLILHIIKQMKEVMEAEGVSVILHDEEKNEFVFCWAESDPDGLVTKLKEMRFPVNKGIAGSVFKSGKAELISNISEDARHYKKIDHSTGFETSSMIAAPLRKKEKTVGVLEVLNKKQGNFAEEDLTFVTTLTPIIAMALDNARMYAELDGSYRELQVVSKEQDKLLRHTQEENIILRQEIEGRHSFSEIIGNSKVMMDLFRLCEKVMDLDITVLIEGETGKSWLPAVFTTTVQGKTDHLSLRTAAAFQRPYSRVSFSAIGKGLSPVPLPTRKGSLKPLMAVQSFSMRWGRCRRRCKRVFCGFYKMVRSDRWAQITTRK